MRSHAGLQQHMGERRVGAHIKGTRRADNCPIFILPCRYGPPRLGDATLVSARWRLYPVFLQKALSSSVLAGVEGIMGQFAQSTPTRAHALGKTKTRTV